MRGTTTLGRAALAAAFLSIAGVAGAADLPSQTYEPMAAPAPVAWSPWQIRLRALAVVPHDSGSVDQIPGSDLSYSNSVTPELDITYFFTPNIAAELILGTTYAEVEGDGPISGLDAGDTWILPPTLTLQYHFTNFGAFKPYVGAGVNYTFFYGTENDDLAAFDIDNSFGLALQVGADYMFNEHWGMNLDVKKLFLSTEWDGRLADGTYVSGDADLDPWLIGAGITYKF
ncbi:OmpW/AlkL family protein [Afifella sp. YEN Y35]|uniref:OmpW/AlkL family protein n=1 Tax=Afifella sp. YEN Y35 TaxID=3388337 RepID=UPI0039E05836